MENSFVNSSDLAQELKITKRTGQRYLQHARKSFSLPRRAKVTRAQVCAANQIVLNASSEDHKT
jgi:hypothetical protein